MGEDTFTSGIWGLWLPMHTGLLGCPSCISVAAPEGHLSEETLACTQILVLAQVEELAFTQ